VLDLAQETEQTFQLYGINQEPTDVFGRQCLMARRLAEQGVRYIQVTYGDNSANPAWDQHSNLPKHGDHARAVDRPIAGLLTDLKQRGLLEDTILWWGGEFGRTPYAQANGTGRDHNPGGFTVWLAGGGLKPGFSHGATDEFGAKAIDGKVHMHDLHATILHQLGLNHEKLIYRYAGRDFRLTDVHGHVVHEILA
jgi:arylsulfatase A-like enzyme